MDSKTLYFQTYPLGIIDVSKLFALLALGTGIYGVYLVSYLISYWILVSYIAGYILMLIYNIKFRIATCGYYQRTTTSKFGKFAQKFPPKIDVENIEENSTNLFVISLLSFIIIVIPPFCGLIFVVFNPQITVILPLLADFGGYVIFIVVPAIMLKKRILPAICKTE
jgi:hypothetical protein